MNSEQTLGQYLSILDDRKYGRGELARYDGKSVYHLPIPLQNRLRKAYGFDRVGMRGKSFAPLSLRAADAMLKNGITTKAEIRKQIKSGGLRKLPGIGPKIAEELERWAAADGK